MSIVSAGAWTGIGHRIGPARWTSASSAIPLAILLVLVLVNPHGLVGGGSDDWHYLDAAQCIARHGLCLPTDHWQARFPLILPLGATIALLGEGEAATALVPALYAVAGLLLLVANVRRSFGDAAAMLAGAVFAMTPLVAFNALLPMVDLPEFAWVMAALLGIQVAMERNDPRAAMLAGAALALALMTRTTSIALLPLLALGWLPLPADRRRLALPFAAACAALLGGEALAYAAATGDPLYGWKLSLHHGRIPTTELPAGVDLTRSPILNLDFIRHWRRTMGIEVHWSVDALLNLLASPMCGLSLCGAGALVIVRWRAFRDDRRLTLLAVAALMHFVLLTFVLAIDPKPRMFVPACAVAATVIGVLGVGAWRQRQRSLLVALIVLLALRGLVVAYDQLNPIDVRRAAAIWLAAAPANGLATDEWTRRTLVVLPEARDLPLIETAPERLRLTVAQGRCAGGTVMRQRWLGRHEWQPLEWLRARRLVLLPQTPMHLCLVRPT